MPSPQTGVTAPLRSGAGLAVLVAGIGFLILPVGDAMGKYLVVQGVSPMQISWGRWVAHVLALTPIVALVAGRTMWRWPVQPGLQMLRAVCLFATTILFFTGLVRVPLADATAVLFVAPLIVTALSFLLLRESVGLWRLGAVVVGFLGMLLIVKPGLKVIDGAMLAVLGAAAGFAVYLVLTRKIAGHNSSLVAIWWMGVFGTLVMSLAVIPFWQPLTLQQWGILGAIGVVMAFGHLLVIWAAERAEASAIAPTPYLEIVTSTMLGYWIFDTLPDALSWVGIVIVIAAGLIVAWRERARETPLHDGDR